MKHYEHVAKRGERGLEGLRKSLVKAYPALPKIVDVK